MNVYRQIICLIVCMVSITFSVIAQKVDHTKSSHYYKNPVSSKLELDGTIFDDTVSAPIPLKILTHTNTQNWNESEMIDPDDVSKIISTQGTIAPAYCGTRCIKKAILKIHLHGGGNQKTILTRNNWSYQTTVTISPNPLCSLSLDPIAFSINQDTPEQVYYIELPAECLQREYTQCTRNATNGLTTITLTKEGNPTFSNIDPNEWVTISMDASLTLEYEQHADNVEISSYLNSYGNFSCPLGQLPLHYPAPFITANKVAFAWNLANGFTSCPDKISSYQIQILRLYNFENNGVVSNDENVIFCRIDWEKALTLFTEREVTNLEITIAEGKGYYAWRVRPIFDYYEGGINNTENYGQWSKSFSQNQEISINTCTPIESLTRGSGSMGNYGFGGALFFYNGLDNAKNWSFSRGFAEGDDNGIKMSESITYANALLQPIQTQLRDFTNDRLLVKQQVYDYNGRAAVNIMPASLQQNYLGFVNNAVTNSAGTAYTTSIIDNPALTAGVSPNYVTTQTINPTSPMGAYYTPSPTETVPNAQGYSLEKFTVGADGKIARIGSVGSTHALSSTSPRNATMAYSSVSDIELTSIFGYEAPRADAVSKQLITDPNGVVSVVYSDIGGKVLATCLKPKISEIENGFIKDDGTNSTEQLLGLEGEKVNELTIIDKLKSSDITPIADDRISVLSKEYTFTADQISPSGLQFKVSYDVTSIPSFETLYGKGPDNCANFCKQCDYKVKIQLRKIRSTDGKIEKKVLFPLLIEEKNNFVNGRPECQNSPNVFDQSEVTFLITEPGDYIVERIVEGMNEDVIEGYVNDALSGIKTIEEILNDLFIPGSIAAYCPNPFDIPIIQGDFNNPNKLDAYELAKIQYNSYKTKYSVYNGVIALRNASSCNTIELPKINCATACDVNDPNNYGKFEKYLREQVPIKNGENNIETYKYFYRYDGKLLAEYVGFSQNTGPANGFFDEMITNMIICGYSCEILFEAWQSVVAEYNTIRNEYIRTKSLTDPVISEQEARAFIDLNPVQEDGNAEGPPSTTKLYVCYDIYEEFLQRVGRFKCNTPVYPDLLVLNQPPTDYKYVVYKSDIALNSIQDYILTNGHKHIIIDKDFKDDDGNSIFEVSSNIVTNDTPPLNYNINFKDNSNPQLDLNNLGILEDRKREAAVNQLYASYRSRELMQYQGVDEVSGSETLLDLSRKLLSESDYSVPSDLIKDPEKYFALLNTRCENSCNNRFQEFQNEFLRLMREEFPLPLFPVGAIRPDGTKVLSTDSDVLLQERIDCAIDRMIVDCRNGCNLQIDNGVMSGVAEYTERMSGIAKLKVPTSTANNTILCPTNYRSLGSSLSVMQGLVNYLNEEYNKLSHYNDPDRDLNSECVYPITEHVNFADMACTYLQSVGVPCPPCIDNNPELDDVTVYPCMYGAFSFIGGENSTDISDIQSCSLCQLMFTQDIPCENSPLPDNFNTYLDNTWNQKTTIPNTYIQASSQLFNTNDYFSIYYLGDRYFDYSDIVNTNLINNLGWTPNGGFTSYTPIDPSICENLTITSLPLKFYPKFTAPHPNLANGILNHPKTYFDIQAWLRRYRFFVYDGLDYYGNWSSYTTHYITGVQLKHSLENTWSFFPYIQGIFPRNSITNNGFGDPYFLVKIDPFITEYDNALSSVRVNLDYGITVGYNVFRPQVINTSNFQQEFAERDFIGDYSKEYSTATNAGRTSIAGLLQSTFTQSIGNFELDNLGFLRFKDKLNDINFRYRNTQLYSTVRKEINCSAGLCNTDFLCDALCIRYEKPEPHQQETPPSFTTIIPNDCSMEEVKRAKLLIVSRYTALKKQIAEEVRAAYSSACNARKVFDDELKVTYDDQFYHYTLYYYDIAGNLIKTVSPKGVDFNESFTRLIAPNHQFVTRFEYNSAGQIIKEETTDGGITLYAYNKRGQLRAVQNARQRAANRYSIVNYDYLQRVKSSMEIDAAAPLTPLSYTNQFTDIVGNNPTDISTLTYSTPTSVASLPAPYNSGTGQKNLRNRLSSVTFDNDALNGDDQATSYYSYDAHGNLDWVIHSNPGLSGIKIEYDYELISGNVKRLNYRRGYKDQLFQRFIYDRDNRLTSGQTSLDTVIWDNDITYSYYHHGPLKRAIIGEDKVQGTDYVYTLQGQLKSINHGSGIRTNDPGQDGIGDVTADYTRVAADAFSLTLGYFDGDYIDHTGGNSIFGTANAIHAPPYNLYDGNISVITSKADGTGLGLSPDYHNDKSIAHLYRYDKLGRLREELFTFKDGANYSRGSGSTIKPFDSYYSYDENSNLKHLSRRSLVGNNPVTANRIDSLSYNYAAGGTNSNRLLSVGDIDGSTPEVNDLQGNSGNNYIYNADGTLSQDVQEKVDYFWNSNDKIRKIVKKDANNLPLVTIVFDYDAQGNKVRKTVFNANNEQLHTTYYVYDALGTLLAIYKKEGRYGQIALIEAPINAPDRIGMWRFYQGEKPHDNFPLPINPLYTRNVGKKLYELTDQTGNVRVVITDRKKVEGVEARPEIAMSGNYYPYGMAQAGRVASTGADYRYGYNGMEEEDRGDQVSAEIASTGEKPKPGEGNLLNTEYRLYDPRLAQWLTRDPIFQPWESPYSAMAGNPILFSDPHGDTPGTEHTPQAEAEGSGGAGTNKDNVVRFGGSSNRKVEETTQKLEKNTNQKPTIGIPLGIEIATTKDVRFVYEGNSILGIQMYYIVTNDGIVGTLGILLPSTDTKPTYIVHTESEKGANEMSLIAQSLQNRGHHVVSSGEFAGAAGGGNGTNPSKPSFDSEIRTFVPKSSAKQASPPPAAKQKTDLVAGSETLDDALRGTEQPLNRLDNNVNTNPRGGSASWKSRNPKDTEHYFSNIIDNYAGEAVKFSIPDHAGRMGTLYQLEAAHFDKNGIFEWVVRNNVVTHRRFIEGGKITGTVNQKVNK